MAAPDTPVDPDPYANKAIVAAVTVLVGVGLQALSTEGFTLAQ